MSLLPASLLEGIFARAMEYPLRCKPVYLEGVWGGYYIPAPAGASQRDEKLRLGV